MHSEGVLYGGAYLTLKPNVVNELDKSVLFYFYDVDFDAIIDTSCVAERLMPSC